MQKILKFIKFSYILLLTLFVFLGVLLYGFFRPVPSFFLTETDAYNGSEFEFIQDVGYIKNHQFVYNNMVYNKAYQLIEMAQNLIVLDVPYIPLMNKKEFSDEELNNPSDLLTLLAKKKRDNPNIQIFIFTDLKSTFYHTNINPALVFLKKMGITVGQHDVSFLKDSNKFYAAVYRCFFSIFGTKGKGFFPNPIVSDGEKVTFRSLLKWLHLKFSYRHLLVTDQYALISSGYFLDSEALISRTAAVVKGRIVSDILKSENELVKALGVSIPDFDIPMIQDEGKDQAQFLTENKYYQHVIKSLQECVESDEVTFVTDEISNSNLIKVLKEAAQNGVTIQLVLNGQNKIRNMVYLQDLILKSDNKIRLKWYEIQDGEFQNHTLVIKGNRVVVAYVSSVSFSRKQFSDSCLSSAIRLESHVDLPLGKNIVAYVQNIWTNQEGHYTVLSDLYMPLDALDILKIEFLDWVL